MFDVRDLQQGVAELQQVRTTLGASPTEWTSERITSASELQKEAMSRIGPASSGLQSNPLLNIASGLPGLHDQAQAVFDLASASDDAGIATGDLVEVAAHSPDPNVGEQAGTSTPTILALLAGSQPQLNDAQTHLDRGVAQLKADENKPLLPPLASKVRTAVNELGPAQTTVDVAAGIGRYMPAALGMSGGPQTYLLLFANSWELRPAGGYYGTVGVITFSGGRPTALKVIDTNTFAQGETRVPVPAPLAAHLILPNNSMDIGDSGWDPDFRTSAALAEQLYHAGTGQSVDGVIEVDPYAISAMLAVTGPVTVPPYGTFTSANFLPKLNTLINVVNGPSQNKSALTPITQAVLSHVIDSSASLLPKLLAAGESTAEQHHVQLFFNNATLAAAAHQAGLDGALAQPTNDSDYLMVVDANVGGNKADEFVTRQTQVRVGISSKGVVAHEVTLTYKFSGNGAEPGLHTDLAYRDYVRFLVPKGMKLQGFYDVSSAGDGRFGSVEDISTEEGRTVIGTFFRLPPGQSIQLHLFYVTAIGKSHDYRLFVQKQAGIDSRPLTVVVGDPAGIERRTGEGRRNTTVMASW